MDNNKSDITLMTAEREKVIVRTSIIGILANVLLAGFKAAIGIITRSIAVTLDAVNNLSDALSSVITIIGAKLGGKKPDKKHPLGYGRIEYLSSMIVAAIVLYAGITALVESIKKIIEPEPAEYTIPSLLIIAAAVVVKLLLGRYVKNQGEKVNSGALVASGSDASFDAILSASVLASAVIYMIWGISLEACVGVVIAVFIIKAGIEMLSETLSDIIGQRADPEMSKLIKKLVAEEPEVRGAYDLILYNYGPDKDYATLHMELPDTMTVEEVDVLTRKVQAKVFRETGVILTGIGVYSYNTSDDEASQMRNSVQKKVLEHDWAIQMHGFYADMEEKTIRFDVVLSFEADRKEAMDTLNAELKEMYPDFTPVIIADVDASD